MNITQNIIPLYVIRSVGDRMEIQAAFDCDDSILD